MSRAPWPGTIVVVSLCAVTALVERDTAVDCLNMLHAASRYELPRPIDWRRAAQSAYDMYGGSIHVHAVAQLLLSVSQPVLRRRCSIQSINPFPATEK